MLRSNTPYAVRLVRPDDAEYVAFMRRQASLRPSRGGPRHKGEWLGGLVERCARHVLGQAVPLQDERILSWEQRLRNGRVGRLYRELDAVWTIDRESVCVFEIKFTFADNCARGVGISQLRAAQELLFATGQYQYALLRLVYIGDEPVAVLDDLPVLEATDEWEELGVIWIATDMIAQAAQELGIELPADWREPEAREGALQTEETEEWRQFADTADTGEPSRTAGSAAPASGGLNALAQALQRAGLQPEEADTDTTDANEADANEADANKADVGEADASEAHT